MFCFYQLIKQLSGQGFWGTLYICRNPRITILPRLQEVLARIPENSWKIPQKLKSHPCKVCQQHYRTCVQSMCTVLSFLYVIRLSWIIFTNGESLRVNMPTLKRQFDEQTDKLCRLSKD